MKISTQTDRLAKIYGEEEAIRKLAEIGYDAYDFSMFEIGFNNHPLNGSDYEAYAYRLRRAADESGIVCNQSHAPFPSYIQGNDEYNKRIFPLLVRAIEVTGILGGKYVIIHPAIFSGHKIGANEECLKTNMELYHSLLPHARKHHVKIAVENMYNWYRGDATASPATCSFAEEFVDYIDALGADNFVACLDIGHCEMQNTGGESAAKMIRALSGKRLKALHVHDNDLLHDSHTLPFTEKINWDEVMTALKEINYNGEFTFEADNFLSKFPPELAVHASRLMLEVGRYLVTKYDL